MISNIYYKEQQLKEQLKQEEVDYKRALREQILRSGSASRGFNNEDSLSGR